MIYILKKVQNYKLSSVRSQIIGRLHTASDGAAFANSPNYWISTKFRDQYTF